MKISEGLTGETEAQRGQALCPRTQTEYTSELCMASAPLSSTINHLSSVSTSHCGFQLPLRPCWWSRDEPSVFSQGTGFSFADGRDPRAKASFAA